VTTDTAHHDPYLNVEVRGSSSGTTSAELEAALWACDFAILVWQLPDGVVRLANDAAAALFDLSPSTLAGSTYVDLLDPADAVEESFAAISSGSLDGVRGQRTVRRHNGEPISVTMWSRAIDMDDARVAVSLYVPADDIGRLGRDPGAPWRSLTPLAAGTTDRSFRIRVVTSDIVDLIGLDAAELRNSNLLDLIHSDDVHSVTDPLGVRTGLQPEHRVRLRHRDGHWVDVCVLVAPLRAHGQELVAFVLLGLPPSTSESASDRVAELELRLRHIGAEVRAARILDDIETFPAISDRPELNELTSRQWEILSRLLQGERIPTIAQALFVSQSTVRNHLANIYAKVGVHSQAELLAALR